MQPISCIREAWAGLAGLAESEETEKGLSQARFLLSQCPLLSPIGSNMHFFSLEKAPVAPC